MPHLYPLRLHPEFYERIWGARSLAPIYSRQITGDPIGEVWLTSDTCKVANGPLAGRSLGELSRQFGRNLLGEATARHSHFPLLIKFLFPRDKLSVQVHPDDETAARAGQPCGKTECWYVLRADTGAQIGLGLTPGTTRSEVKRAIYDSTLERLLNWIEPYEGDLIYVDAGTVHALGPGMVIVEIQQNSDVTYRLYDYGRPRELHIEAGLAATREWTHAGKVERQQPHSERGKHQVNLVTSPCFVVDRFRLVHPWEFRRARHARRSVWCLVVTQGSGILLSDDCEPIQLSCGDVVVTPAAVERFTLNPQWHLEFLCASLPVEKVTHPRTALVDAGVGVAQ